MPAYLVKSKDGTIRRIVLAEYTVHAIRHVCETLFTSDTLTAVELAREIMKGTAVEDITPAEKKEKPKPAQPPAAGSGEPYAHKLQCPADSSTPIGKVNCICQALDIETQDLEAKFREVGE